MGVVPNTNFDVLAAKNLIDYVFWATSKNILAVLTPLTEWDYMKYLCKKNGTYEGKRLI